MTFPRFRLYDETGAVLIYEFDCVINIDDNQDPCNFVEHESLRGQGSIVIPGSDASWDLPMSFVLVSSGATSSEKYEDLSTQINTVKTSIEKFTKYILKVDITEVGGTQDYNVMRTNSMSFPIGDSTSKRVNVQTVDLVFRVNTW